MPKYTARTADKHELYEKAVQCPEADIDFVIETFCREHGSKPRMLREDFCGTASAAVDFVKRSRKNRAIGVDLDADTLEWGRRHHVSRLGRRAGDITLINANVLDVTEPKVQVILGMNFSYFIFKERKNLLRYFRTALESLEPGGMLFLDAYGGSQAQMPQKEKKKCKGFTYIWDQHAYNPVTSEVVNYIHFRFPDGSKLKRAFTYEWRLWTLREITEALEEVGFADARVYWEGWDEENDEGDGDFQPVDEAENCDGWIAYVVGRRGG